MEQKYIQVQKPKSGSAKSAREVAPVAAIEEQYAKLEEQLSNPKASEGGVVELVQKIEEFQAQLDGYKKNLKGGGAQNYLKEVKKYGESLIRSYGVSHLTVLYNRLISSISGEAIGKQKQFIGAVGELLKKYKGK